MLLINCASLLAKCRIKAIFFSHGPVMGWINRHYIDLVCVDYLAGVRIDDGSRIACPVNFDLFSGFTVYVHRCTAFLLVLMDIMAEPGIHQRIVSIEHAFFEVFRPKELLIDTIAEQFLTDVIIIWHAF